MWRDENSPLVGTTNAALRQTQFKRSNTPRKQPGLSGNLQPLGSSTTNYSSPVPTRPLRGQSQPISPWTDIMTSTRNLIEEIDSLLTPGPEATKEGASPLTSPPREMQLPSDELEAVTETTDPVPLMETRPRRPKKNVHPVQVLPAPKTTVVYPALTPAPATKKKKVRFQCTPGSIRKRRIRAKSLGISRESMRQKIWTKFRREIRRLRIRKRSELDARDSTRERRPSPLIDLRAGSPRSSLPCLDGKQCPTVLMRKLPRGSNINREQTSFLEHLRKKQIPRKLMEATRWKQLKGAERLNDVFEVDDDMVV